MKHTKLVSVLAFLFALGCLASPSDARRRKKKKRKPVAAKINVEALEELMGPFEFGMNKGQILGVLSKQLDERYAEQIKETSDVYEQDRLRSEKKEELAKIGQSYTKFQGVKTGWDVSIVDDQFGHKTDESMMVYWELNADGKDQRRFFFFHEGGLYKMFITLDAKMLPKGKRNFETFQTVMNQRYGTGKTIAKKTAVDSDKVVWETAKLHVQAIDKLSFYGSFCLVIANPLKEAEVALARDAVRVVKKRNSVIDSMIETDGDDLTLDP